LEVIIKDRYVWVPFEHIKRLQISPPKQLRDLLWASARVEGSDGTLGEVYVPALYAGSSDSGDEQVKLGRATDWKLVGVDLYRAAGLRLFVAGGEEKSIFEISAIEFNQAAAAQTAQTQDAGQ
jgi:type VI secretion system protein ImpE